MIVALIDSGTVLWAQFGRSTIYNSFNILSSNPIFASSFFRIEMAFDIMYLCVHVCVFKCMWCQIGVEFITSFHFRSNLGKFSMHFMFLSLFVLGDYYGLCRIDCEIVNRYYGFNFETRKRI